MAARTSSACVSVGGADRHKLDVVAREQFVDRCRTWCCCEHRVGRPCVRCRDQVSANNLARGRVEDGANRAATLRGVARCMRATHEAKPNDPNADHSIARGRVCVFLVHACGVNTTPLSM